MITGGPARVTPNSSGAGSAQGYVELLTNNGQKVSLNQNQAQKGMNSQLKDNNSMNNNAESINGQNVYQNGMISQAMAT